MGEVYLAEDTLLARRVALKRVNAELAATDKARERLHREARAAARLNHAGIAAVHDLVTHEGQPFLVMEYVAGRDLATVVRDQGALPPADTIRVGLELTSALAVAHENGVIHRDLKPANVSLGPDGHIKILDFGLSQLRATEADAEAPTVQAAPRTAATQVYGSPGYSAPEQLLGRPTDPRADVFAAGATLYFLCTARGPFSGTDAMSLALASLTEAPPRADAVAPAVPRALAEVLARAMARDPADRFDSAQALHDALAGVRDEFQAGSVQPAGAARARRPPRLVAALAAVAVAAAVIAAVGLLWWMRAPAGEAIAPGAAPVVAVLLPENLTGDPANDFLAVGFADSLFTDLAGLPDVTVVPPADVREDAGPIDRDRREIARSLGASFLVDSSVQRAGSQLRVNARLVSAEGRVVWRSDFAGDMDGIFDLQRRMAEGVAEGLQLRLRPEDTAGFGPRAGTDVDALADYWRGRTLLERPDSPDHVEAAVAAFESAVSKDADLAEAHAGLGEACWVLYGQTGDPTWVDRAIQASERALELAPSQTRVWLTLALVHNGTGQSDRALADLERAIELQPNGDDAYRVMAGVLADAGRTDDALHAFDEAIARRPRYWRNHHTRGVLLYRVGRYDEAKAAFETVVQLQPDSASGYQALGTVMQVTGDLDGARQAYEKALQVAPSRGSYSNLGTIHYWEGRFEDAAEAYRRAIDLAPRNALYHRNIGDAYTRLGQVENARTSYGTAVSLLEQDLEVNPKDIVALSELAVVEMKLGQLGRAQQHVAEALALAPDDGEVLYAHAVITALAGRAADALPILQRAVEQGASLQVVERDDDLESVRSLPEYATWRQTQGGGGPG